MRGASAALWLASAWLASGCTTAPVPREEAAAAQPLAAFTPATLYLARRGWHVEVGFAAAELRPPLAAMRGQFPGARYLFFGFGDRHYLMARSHHVPTLLGALWPGPALILVTALRGSPREAFGEADVLAFSLSAAQSRAAQAFLWRSLDVDERAAGLTAYAPGPYEGSLYFAARARYSALHTCNTWVAEVLRAAGYPAHTTLVILAGQLWREARRMHPITPPAAG